MSEIRVRLSDRSISANLSSRTGSSSATIPSGATKEAVRALGVRVTAAEEDIDALEARMTAAEGDIDGLQAEDTSIRADFAEADSFLSQRIDMATGSSVNLIKYPYLFMNKMEPVVINGITFTPNPDGSVTANGTATASARYYFTDSLLLDYGKTYFLSGCPSGGSASTYRIRCDSANATSTYVEDTGAGKTVSPSSEERRLRRIFIIIANGTTVTDLVFKPMLNAGSEAEEYINPAAANDEQARQGLEDLRAEVAEDMAGIAAELATKADIDGYYEEMTVGNAEQIISTVFIEDSEPYNFRKTGGSANVGNREYDTVVGGSLAWNQLEPLDVSKYTRANSYSTLTLTDGVYTLESVTDNSQHKNWRMLCLEPNHKYFVFAEGNNTSTNHNAVIQFKNNAASLGASILSFEPSETFVSKATIANAGTYNCFAYAYPAAAENGAKASFKNVQLVDLTTMLGQTIADYIYELETATAGAGVALFLSLFPKKYYPYHAASMESVKTSAHETVGFNQWDEQWELGTFDTDTGLPSATSTRIRCKNPIPVISGATYYVGGTGTFRVWWYDSDDNLISTETTTTSNRLFIAPTNACYLRFSPGTIYGTTYKSDICINFSHSGYRNGEYEPYVKHTYKLQPIVLRGVLKLDSNSQVYYDGDTYAHDGPVTRRYAEVTVVSDMVSAFVDSGAVPRVTVTVNPIPLANTLNTFNTKAYKPRTNVPTDSGWIRAVSSGFHIFDSAFTDLATAQSLLEGMTIIYELATPTTEQAAPYTSPQVCDGYGTEEYVDYAYTQGLRDVQIPVGHKTRYPIDLRGKLESLPGKAAADGTYMIRQTRGRMELTPYPPADDDMIADANIARGMYFAINSQLYLSTRAISAGETIVVGSNCIETSITDALNDIIQAL